MSTTDMSSRRRRRRLSPSEKYEIYVSVLTGQATQREAAVRLGVDRSTDPRGRRPGALRTAAALLAAFGCALPNRTVLGGGPQ